MKELKDKLFKINLGTFVITIILLICNFIPGCELFKMILLILTFMNTGIILSNLWLMNQLKKIK